MIRIQVADVISEYSLGEHNGKSTYIETLRPLYNTYIASLKNLRRAHLDRYRNLLVRLHDDCMYVHCHCLPGMLTDITKCKIRCHA